MGPTYEDCLQDLNGGPTMRQLFDCIGTSSLSCLFPPLPHIARCIALPRMGENDSKILTVALRMYVGDMSCW